MKQLLPFDQLSKSGKASRLWRERNPEKAYASIEKANKKYRNSNRAKKIIAAAHCVFKAVNISNTNNFRTREILRMHARGRDLGTIVVATGFPMSLVTKVIAANTPPKSCA